MRKFLFLILTSLILSSCSVLTIKEAEPLINPPEYENLIETRYRVIQEEEIERENWMKENAVYEYPENISDIVIPHNYRPLRSRETIETKNRTLSVLFIPLENPEINKIINDINHYSYDFLILTGEREDLVSFSKTINKDSVLLEEGLVIYKTELLDMEQNAATFVLNSEKNLEIAVLNSFTALPDNKEEMKEYVESLKIDENLDKLELENSEVLLALSSASPSSDDWNALTLYTYRTLLEFEESEKLENLGFSDIYRETHYSAETDSGITRENGEIFERLDFLLEKNLVPVKSFTLSVNGNDARALYAEVLV